MWCRMYRIWGLDARRKGAGVVKFRTSSFILLGVGMEGLGVGGCVGLERVATSHGWLSRVTRARTRFTLVGVRRAARERCLYACMMPQALSCTQRASGAMRPRRPVDVTCACPKCDVDSRSWQRQFRGKRLRPRRQRLTGHARRGDSLNGAEHPPCWGIRPEGPGGAPGAGNVDGMAAADVWGR